jgi:hypothetical protein
LASVPPNRLTGLLAGRKQAERDMALIVHREGLKPIAFNDDVVGGACLLFVEPGNDAGDLYPCLRTALFRRHACQSAIAASYMAHSFGVMCGTCGTP